MTSSLVGSEMCIRDSFCSERARLPCVDRPPTQHKMLAEGRTTLVRDLAVSYTHLTLPTICSV
eukprot:6617368-Prorocentrum_lima.AAC.1